MLNTRDLEERWLKYKIKSYIPHATIAISLVIIVVITSIFFSSNKEEKKTPLLANIKKEKHIEHVPTVVTKVAKKALPKQEVVQIKKTTIEEAPKTVLIPTQDKLPKSDDTSLKLSPSLDFMKKMQHSSLPYYQDEKNTEKEVLSDTSVYTSQKVEQVLESDAEENIQVNTIEEEPEKITIQRHDTSDDLRDIIKRFKKNNSPALSLFIAKKYYELGEYHKAYNYALITNEIDREIDASWIVFAKSLVKLNQKDMAIKTLKQYVKSSHSSSAKILLDEISSGKFK